MHLLKYFHSYTLKRPTGIRLLYLLETIRLYVATGLYNSVQFRISSAILRKKLYKISNYRVRIFSIIVLTSLSKVVNPIKIPTNLLRLHMSIMIITIKELVATILNSESPKNKMNDAVGSWGVSII